MDLHFFIYPPRRSHYPQAQKKLHNEHLFKTHRRVNIIVGKNMHAIQRGRRGGGVCRLDWFLIQTCSSRSCRILKDCDRSRVCRQVHAVNSALHAARDRATRAREAQTTRSLRTRLLCRIRCMLVRTALLLTAADHPKSVLQLHSSRA